MVTKISMPGADEAELDEVEEVVEEAEDTDLDAGLQYSPDYDSLEEDDEDPLEPQSVSDVPPETEIWTGGPTAGTVKDWMEQYKGVYVTSISFEEHYAWRTLKRSEYARISTQLESIAEGKSETEITMLNEELICMTCVLYPEITEAELDDLPAGIPTLISQHILERSGFTAIGLREMF